MTPDEQYRQNFASIDWSQPIVTHKPARHRGPRGDVPAPRLIRDDIGGIKSMQDGKIYDSRSALYRSYKEGGTRIIEAGEGPAEPVADKITKAEVAEAVQKVKQGYKPAPAEAIEGVDDD